MKSHPLLKDDLARVSFAVIGIFLILGSSVTSVYIGMYEQQGNEKNTWNTDQNNVETLLAKARVDLAQVLNGAGVNALQYIGNHPVIIPSESFTSAEKCNQFRLKQKISEVLTEYLQINYIDSICIHNDLKLMVDHSKLSSKGISSDSLLITPIEMQLERPIGIPFFGPEKKQNMPVYYQITCEIPVIILSKTSEENNESLSLTLSVSTVLTNRFLALQDLLHSFNESLHGLGPFWKTITLIANVYSMARGFRHYKTGKPQNVVENKHLELITNLVFLFQTALTFGGIDPQLLIETAKETKSVFSGEETTNISLVNSMSSPDWGVSFSEFQDHYDPESTSNLEDMNQQLVNISDIAYSILYNATSLHLHFLDTTNQEQLVSYQLNSERSLDEVVQQYLDYNWIFTGSSQGEFQQNHSTIQKIQSVSENVYSSSFYTKIKRIGPSRITLGNNSGFPIDNGSSSWIFKNAVLESQKSKPEKGTITSGSIVYEEVYTIVWKRSHWWSNKTTQIIDNETIESWSELVTTDYKYEENVTFSITLKDYADIKNVVGEIKDVFYENLSFSDSNLVTTIPAYHQDIYEPVKQDLFTSEEGIYVQSTVFESPPSWIYDKAYEALLQVYDSVSRITIDEDINAVNYPNPNLLLSLAFQDIIDQFESNKTFFEQKNLYFTNGEFDCTGSKVIYAIRKWYVNLIHQQLYDLYDQTQRYVEDAITDALNDAGISEKKPFDESMDESIVSSLNRQLSIPFSVEMHLQKKEASLINSWNETLLLSVDHTPPYFSCFSKESYDGKEEYFLGIQNTCILGPTGLPLLPITPATPWLVTLNTWFIQIRGSIAEFSIRDHNDETVFHPLFCYEPQEYVRKNEIIRANDGTILGFNTRLSFSVDTVTCSIVPSWGFMVGDKKGGLFEHDGRSIS